MTVIVWTLAATLGTVIAIWNTVEAWHDLRALGVILDGRRIIAVGWVRREAIRVFIQGSWAFIGFLSLPTARDTLNPIVVLLVATNVAVAVNTILDARDRIRLGHIINP